MNKDLSSSWFNKNRKNTQLILDDVYVNDLKAISQVMKPTISVFWQVKKKVVQAFLFLENFFQFCCSGATISETNFVDVWKEEFILSSCLIYSESLDHCSFTFYGYRYSSLNSNLKAYLQPHIVRRVASITSIVWIFEWITTLTGVACMEIMISQFL
jgi:hypothetical protein